MGLRCLLVMSSNLTAPTIFIKELQIFSTSQFGTDTQFVHSCFLDTARFENIERSLYRDTNNGNYYERVTAGGKDSFISLRTTKVATARQELAVRRLPVQEPSWD